MPAKLCLQQQQRQRRHQQHHGRVADGQQIQCKNRQKHHERAQRAGNNGSRRVEFEIDQQRASHQQQQGDIRVHQPAQQPLAQRGPQHDNPRAANMKHLLAPVHTGDRAPVQRGQQLRIVVGDQVNEVLVQRLFGGIGMRRLNGGFRSRGIAIAPGHVGAQKGLRIVLDLLAHGFVRLAAEFQHRVSRAGVGAGCHGSHVRRLQQKEPRRSRPRAPRRYIHDYRNP